MCVRACERAETELLGLLESDVTRLHSTLYLFDVGHLDRKARPGDAAVEVTE